MKRTFLTGLLIVTTFLSFAQCLKTFNVLKNGSATGTYPGYGNVGDNNYQQPDASYTNSGQVQVSFTSALPQGVKPPAILTVTQSSPGVQSYDYKYALLSISTDRTSAIYIFYGKKNSQNLPNGSQVKYTITIQYANQSINTCYGVDNTPPPTVLPVLYSSFKLTYAGTSKVLITWATLTEQNTTGFYVQKNISGEWKNLGFVPSKSVTNIASALNYSFYDEAATKGTYQYRIQGVDVDGRVFYSEVKTISVEATSDKILLYPNPSLNGRVNIAFMDNATLHDIVIYNTQGKIIKTYMEAGGDLFTIDGLTSGLYVIKITNHLNAVPSIQRIIIK